MRIAGIAQESLVDGPGIRATIFLQGCFNNCQDCHNPTTHDINGGEERDVIKILDDLNNNPLLDGFTFSGGDPLHFLHLSGKDQDSYMNNLGRVLTHAYTLKPNLIGYTGYSYFYLISKISNTRYMEPITIEHNSIPEELYPKCGIMGVTISNTFELKLLKILTLCNFWITEPFIPSQRSAELAFRGSRNQRVLAINYRKTVMMPQGILRVLDVSKLWDEGYSTETFDILKDNGFDPLDEPISRLVFKTSEVDEE